MSWILVAMADLAALCRRRSRELAKLADHLDSHQEQSDGRG
jgi:hypothetical protein